MIISRFLPCAMILLLCACTGPAPGQPHPYEGYLHQKELELPSPDKFQHCQSYGCEQRSELSLTKREWARVTAPLRGVKNAAQERKAIAKSIGIMEQIVGKKTGTDRDKAGTFASMGDGQLDCVDESINTTMTLAMLEQKKHLKFHTVSRPQSRTPATTLGRGVLWPHQTAVIFDNKSGEAFAVDSWFRDNGEPADIIAMSEWMRGWSPEVETLTVAEQ